MSETRFRWAENLSPRLLKSPWWIGHIPFAFEIVGRLEPRVIVELGTYSGSSFAAFCQAAEACVPQARCYGIDLWEGDIHMGRLDDTVYRDVAAYLATHYPSIATLVRKDENVRPARYYTEITEKNAKKHVFHELMNRFFRGSAADLVLHALRSEQLSAGERATIMEKLKSPKKSP